MTIECNTLLNISMLSSVWHSIVQSSATLECNTLLNLSTSCLAECCTRLSIELSSVLQSMLLSIRVQHTQHSSATHSTSTIECTNEQCVALECAIECNTRVQHTAQLVNVLLSRVLHSSVNRVEQCVAPDATHRVSLECNTLLNNCTLDC